jgi:endonuclease/exonuclease/phosphatase family metal-dependent hydrolase
MPDRPILIMTYNILGARHQAALNAVVRQLCPDVLLVNETPKLPMVSTSQCRWLGRQWGLRFRVGGRTAGGNMITSGNRLTTISTSATRIPQPAGQPIRGVVTVQAALSGEPIGFVGCHLSLIADSRVREVVDYVLVAADRLNGPVVLAGDLNETSDEPAWQRILDAGFVDHGGKQASTFPAKAPFRRIDAILVRGEVTVLEHRVPEVDPLLFIEASDHLPVTALVTMGQAA